MPLLNAPVDICNLALIRVGQKVTIGDFDTEDSAEALACRVAFEPVRDQLLSKRRWSFARKQVLLALEPTEVRTGWIYAYAVPTDVLDEIGLWPGTRDPRQENLIPFEIQARNVGNGRVLLTDQLAAELVYTARIISVGAFPPLFADALAWHVAGELAMALPVKPQLRTLTETMMERSLKEAAAKDANAKNEYPRVSGIVLSRGSYSSEVD